MSKTPTPPSRISRHLEKGVVLNQPPKEPKPAVPGPAQNKPPKETTPTSHTPKKA